MGFPLQVSREEQESSSSSFAPAPHIPDTQMLSFSADEAPIRSVVVFKNGKAEVTRVLNFCTTTATGLHEVCCLCKSSLLRIHNLHLFATQGKVACLMPACAHVIAFHSKQHLHCFLQKVYTGVQQQYIDARIKSRGSVGIQDSCSFAGGPKGNEKTHIALEKK